MQHARIGLRMFRGSATRIMPALVLTLIAAAALGGCGSSPSPTTHATTAATITSTTDSAGSTSSSAPSTAAAGAKVIMKGSAFDPVTVTIKAGGMVTWENQDSAQHDVAADDGTFKSMPFGKGTSFSFRFAKPGDYTYSCTLQPSMKGEVVVQ
jgi:plastocyanin